MRRYVYQKGRAIAFGSGFEHSTEPGRGRDGQTHAYLCFTFGTDEQQRWPEIARTLACACQILAEIARTFRMRLPVLPQQCCPRVALV